ncbi:hypothetical protein [Marivita hallyeonensis]|uniref:Uncharacterized protein n=1 Tax=Marivita hallyeonensis TaxID=996342 RepID=A0A1M5QP62_9RHOB|nr:hypothetical protein [Marivita hallyeonensis]SHH15874.1 hypothetical protein SAMN05443551_1440 [Marivita hallyeonensis]
MKVGAILGIAVVAVAIAFGVYMVDVEQTEEASLPNVELNVEGGNLPEYNAEVGDIETGTEEVTVTVPTIEIESPEEDGSSG